MNKIKNIIFDMGGVLHKFSPHHIVSQYTTSESEIEQIIDCTFATPLWVEYDRGTVTLDEIYEYASTKLPKNLHTIVRLALDNWYKHFIEIDGAEDFVKSVLRSNYSIYLLSNVGTKFHTFSKTDRILQYFDNYVVSCNIHVNKPDEKIYKHLIDKFNLIPEESIFIDDVIENVNGAKLVGIHAEQFTNYTDLKRILTEKYGINLK